MNHDLTSEDCALFRCPLTGEALQLVDANLKQLLDGKESPYYQVSEIESGLINASGSLFYPILQGVALLLPVYALAMVENAPKANLDRDKAQVFAYYNDLNYIQTDNDNILYSRYRTVGRLPPRFR